MPTTKPLALAGGSTSATKGVLHTLDGTASYDPDGFTITAYSWTMIYKPPASTSALSSTTSANPTFTPDLVGTYRFFLTVTAGGRVSETDQMKAPVAAFISVTVPTARYAWTIPAKGQKDWTDHLYRIFTDLDASGSTDTLLDCTASEAVGHAVYVQGTNLVRSAKADAQATSVVVGIIISKPTTTTCKITLSGKVSVLSGLTAGSRYYLSTSTAGAITSTPTTTSGTYLVFMGVATAADSILLDQAAPIAIT